MRLLILSNSQIAINEDGLYSLNDLHKLSGANHKHLPSQFLRAKSTKEYMDIVKKSEQGAEVIRSSSGRHGGGTWVSPLILMKYASWISLELEFALFKSLRNSESVSVFDLARNIDFDIPKDVERYVYVAQEEVSGRYKVGISQDPERRIKQLNIGNPEKLVLVHAYKALDDGYKSERVAHGVLEENLLRSEWFDENTSLKNLPSYN